MNELALFAGAGGGLLGSILNGWRTVCAVEIEDYCRRVLLQRQRDGVLDKFPVWDDVRSFDGRPWRGCVDIVTGGFPCQPFSEAGERKAEDDHRNMWPDTIRIIREVRPRFAFLENVAALTFYEYFGTILGDLSEAGFDARWQVVSAESVGAPHGRSRLFIVAHAHGERLPANQAEVRSVPQAEGTECGVGPWRGRLVRLPYRSGRHCVRLLPSAGIPRMDDGDSSRLDRLKATGNMQVPAVVRAAWNLLANQ